MLNPVVRAYCGQVHLHNVTHLFGCSLSHTLHMHALDLVVYCKSLWVCAVAENPGLTQRHGRPQDVPQYTLCIHDLCDLPSFLSLALAYSRMNPAAAVYLQTIHSITPTWIDNMSVNMPAVNPG